MEPDAELDNALDAVKARSGRRRRSRQVWLVSGGAALVLLAVVAVLGVKANNRADDRVILDTASSGTSTSIQPDVNGSGTTSSLPVPSTTCCLPVVTTTEPGPTSTTLPPTHPTPPPTTAPPTTFETTTTTTATYPNVDERVVAAKLAWRDHRPQRYRMTVRRSCFCPPDVTDPITIEVDGTHITSPAGLAGLDVDDIYEEASNVSPQGSITEITVDPTYGFPSSISIDHITQAVDDEMYYSITDFQPL
jgi:hypothetical protein